MFGEQDGGAEPDADVGQPAGEKQPPSRQEKPAMFDGPAAQSQRGGNAVQLREKDSRLRVGVYCPSIICSYIIIITTRVVPAWEYNIIDIANSRVCTVYHAPNTRG